MENIPGVTIHYGATVLPNLITPKFVHQKFIQKYKWIEHVSIYHHAKWFNKNLRKKKRKKENLALK